MIIRKNKYEQVYDADVNIILLNEFPTLEVVLKFSVCLYSFI